MNATRNIHDGADIAARIACSLEKLIEQAPDDGEVAVPAARTSLVRPAHGWDSRYVEEAELSGERWHDFFRDAKTQVAGGGIVAFLGNRGTGKTRMAAEIARAGFWPTDKGEWNGNMVVTGKTALYRRAMDIFLDLRDCAKKGSARSEKDVLDSLAHAGLLVIDEFQERGESEWENRILCNLLDKRYATRRPTVLIANHTVAEMTAALSPSVRDRMREGGKAFVFDWGSWRRR
ncbi:ATP-binding protein [Luteolibacter yonseiensis]|uniref:ATP-binding protein n=1 Tax=Luteolibacter yonseiensis TaxID=1144680 RepID=A0A934R405_9BACT|nr:ATP-binding protein [Luteolibacter yonseiensis]MBK1815070.1 ATP-binding protein [Luteolibacter yonseiensis]